MQADNLIKLGINIDHVATLRQARGGFYPDPFQAAQIAINNGADYITVHLREDRRHIQDADVKKLITTPGMKVNLEMAVTDEMISIAEQLKPEYCCIVPEKREELTTEGGLDVVSGRDRIAVACDRLKRVGIEVSLFIDAVDEQISMAKEVDATIIEIHTGHYANAIGAEQTKVELDKIKESVQQASKLGLQVNAGHGLHYDNVKHIAAIPEIAELNIGHSIISRAIFSGLESAVYDMKSLMLEARS